MNVSEFRISRRPLAVAAVLVGMVSLAIGAHAALNMRSLDSALSVASEQAGTPGKTRPSRVAPQRF